MSSIPEAPPRWEPTFAKWFSEFPLQEAPLWIWKQKKTSCSPSLLIGSPVIWASTRVSEHHSSFYQRIFFASAHKCTCRGVVRKTNAMLIFLFVISVSEVFYSICQKSIQNKKVLFGIITVFTADNH